MSDEKQAYVSPPSGLLEITMIRDANPRVTLNLDLGIPNFTVFSMTVPMVEDQPQAMSRLISESVNVLMDEVATFMLSMEYEESVIVEIYALVLNTFKGMSKESDSAKEQDRTGADPIVRTFEGTFKMPVSFVNETQAKVVTAATKILRLPKTRHIELSYEPKRKTTVGDTARVIRQYRNRSLKQQPKPLYVIVYDQMGRPTGTLSLGPQFKNKLLSLTTKRAAVEFIQPMSFPDEQSMKMGLLPPGIPKTISVGDMTYLPEGVAGVDMALYHGPQDYLVKFPDGRSSIFPGRPTFRNMRRLNFPVPRNRFKWTLLPPPPPPEQEGQAGAAKTGGEALQPQKDTDAEIEHVRQHNEAEASRRGERLHWMADEMTKAFDDPRR
jgi:hypothetical protein